MKTKIALAFYYIAIGFLVACAVVIVDKLIFWPPCTQTKTTCVIDPWSTAGLAGTVLAVSATVLAILGAVAVAAWWTSLNATVTERVKKLYKKQQREVNTQVDTLLADQREKVDGQLEGFQKAFQSLEARVTIVRKEIDQLYKSTQDLEEIAVDGLTMVIGADLLEQWAQKATEDHKFSRVPLKMAESYLNSVEYRLAQAEEALVDGEKYLDTADDFYRTRFLNATYTPGTDRYAVPSLQNLQSELSKHLDNYTKSFLPVPSTLDNWEGAWRWLEIALNDDAYPKQDGNEFASTLETLAARAEALRPRIEQLKQNRDRLMVKTEVLLAEVVSYVEAKRKGVTHEENQVGQG